MIKFISWVLIMFAGVVGLSLGQWIGNNEVSVVRPTPEYRMATIATTTPIHSSEISIHASPAVKSPKSSIEVPMKSPTPVAQAVVSPTPTYIPQVIASPTPISTVTPTPMYFPPSIGNNTPPSAESLYYEKVETGTFNEAGGSIGKFPNDVGYRAQYDRRAGLIIFMPINNNVSIPLNWLRNHDYIPENDKDAQRITRIYHCTDIVDLVAQGKLIFGDPDSTVLADCQAFLQMNKEEQINSL